MRSALETTGTLPGVRLPLDEEVSSCKYVEGLERVSLRFVENELKVERVRFQFVEDEYKVK